MSSSPVAHLSGSGNCPQDGNFVPSIIQVLFNAWAFSSNSTILASGDYDHAVKLWELPSGRELRTLTGHTGPVSCIAISPTGTILASGSKDNTIKLWEMEP